MSGVAFVTTAARLRPAVRGPGSQTCSRCARKRPPVARAARVNAVPALAYAAYMTHLFVQSPTGAPTPVASLAEAASLSLNFCYLLPAFLPSLAAPAAHPLLEALFHGVVAWASLLLSFAADALLFSAAPPALLFAAPFLTNIVYLPYLALRNPRPPSSPSPRVRSLLRALESAALPAFALALFVVSIGWGLYARPQFGDLSMRLASFRHVLEHDILAYSFLVDLLVFSLFQAWLVPEDAQQRQWSQPALKTTAVALSKIPFFGLAAYLFIRARHAPLSALDDSPS